MRSLAQACTLVAFAVAVASVTVTPTVAAPAPAPENTRIIFVNLTCGAAGHFHARCTYSVSGGTAPYTYSWNPTPTSWGGGTAYFNCNGSIGVTLTVQDALGATGTGYGEADC